MLWSGITRRAKYGLAAAVCLIFAAGIMCLKTHSRTWGVCVMGLPEKVNIELADEDVPLYILKQTHEPLLRKDDGQNYTSKILSRWRRNVGSTTYEFCPSGKARFDAAHPFTAEYLKKHLDAVTTKYAPEFSTELSGECVVVRFANGRIGYMDFLSMLGNAPTLGKTENIELGLGEFAVKSIDKSRINLSRKEGCSNCYTDIIIYEAAANPEDDLKREDVADFNRISWREFPLDLAERFMSFESIPLKSGGLVLTTTDKDLRRVIYGCVDIPRFRRVVFPHKKKFNNISTILPVGVPGGIAGKPEQHCRPLKKYGRAVLLAAIARGNEAEVMEYAETFRRRTGLEMRVQFYSAHELVKVLFARPHPFDMVAISFSVVQPEYETFFKDFVTNDGLVDYDLPRVSELRRSLLKLEDERGRTELAAKIAKELAGEAAVLPLYQEVRTFYYPAEIKNMMVGRGFTEYPEVADFKW
jgi:hypothetical protein